MASSACQSDVTHPGALPSDPPLAGFVFFNDFCPTGYTCRDPGGDPYNQNIDEDQVLDDALGTVCQDTECEFEHNGLTYQCSDLTQGVRDIFADGAFAMTDGMVGDAGWHNNTGHSYPPQGTAPKYDMGINEQYFYNNLDPEDIWQIALSLIHEILHHFDGGSEPDEQKLRDAFILL